MKKLMALLLAVLMVCCLAACGEGNTQDGSSQGGSSQGGSSQGDSLQGGSSQGDSSQGGSSQGGSSSTVDSAEQKVAEYVRENKDDLLAAMEQSFAASSELTCTSSIKAEGRGFIIRININEFDNLEDSVKQTLQEAYDQMGDYFDQALATMQTELPEIEYFEVVVCEVDGDELAVIHAGK